MLRYIEIRSALDINKVAPNTLNNKISEYSDNTGPVVNWDEPFRDGAAINQGTKIKPAIK